VRAPLGSLKGYLSAYRGLGRDIWLIALSAAMPSIAWGFINVIWAPYLALLGLDEPHIGTLMMISMMAMAVLTMPMGLLADVVGKKHVVATGLALSAVYAAIYYLTADFRWLCLAEFLGGLGAAMSWGPNIALMADKAGESRDYAFSFSFSLWSAFNLTGFLLSGLPDWLRAAYGLGEVEATRLMFLLALAITAIGPLLLLPVEEPPRSPRARKRPFANIRSWSLISRYALVNGLIGFGAGLVVPWFSYFFWRRFGAPYGTIGILFAVTTLVMVPGFILAPKLSSALGPVKAAVLTQGLSIAALVALGSCYDFYLACSLYVARNFLMNVCNPIVQAFTLGLVGEEERASANSIWLTCWNVPSAVSRQLAGYLIKGYSFEAPFFLCAACYSVATGLFYAFFRHGKREGRQQRRPIRPA